mgnify:CR=1 FL=1
MYGMPIRRKGLYGFVIFLIVCMAGVFWLTDGKLEAVEQAAEARRLLGPDKIIGVSARTVEQARKDMVHGIHELRYRKDQIPEEFR